MLVKLSNVLEIVGLLLVLLAAVAWDWRAATFLIGAAMVFVGYTIDPEDEP